MKQALEDAIAARGYTALTPVQEAVLAPGLDGRDMLVSAQTGSGKTLGFGLAIAPALLGEAETFGPAAAPLGLVIAPTRELALQVQRELGWLYAGAGGQVISCVGGMDMRDQRRALARGAHIVVATPGRLRDHIMRGSIDLGGVRAVVLDEADEMLDLGFREDLEFILGEVPEDRQTLLFSATVPASIAGLAASYQRDAARIVTASGSAQHADIDYQAMLVAERDTENAVVNVLRFHEAPNAIVFANTRATVNRLTTRLSNRGFAVVALSGELSQTERSHALQAMRDGRARVCVATDVAARGIDLPNLDLVIHAELPSSSETLLHRSGRTGRAGRKGVSALIVTGKTRKKAERILKFAKLKADWIAAPSAQAIRARDEARMLADPEWQQPIGEAEAAGVETLLASFTPEQIAAAYLRAWRMARSAPEDLAEVAPGPARKGPFCPSVWFTVAGGRKAGAEPRRLLPELCKAGDLTKDDIGAIRVQHDVSYVQLRDTAVERFTAALGPERVLESGAEVQWLAEAPELERSGFARRKGRGPKGQGRPGKPWHGAKPAKPGHRGSRPARDTAPEAGAQPSGKPAGRSGALKRGPKGPPPPPGKPNSKKNRARALAAKKAATKPKKPR